MAERSGYSPSGGASRGPLHLGSHGMPVEKKLDEIYITILVQLVSEDYNDPGREDLLGLFRGIHLDSVRSASYRCICRTAGSAERGGRLDVKTSFENRGTYWRRVVPYNISQNFEGWRGWRWRTTVKRTVVEGDDSSVRR